MISHISMLGLTELNDKQTYQNFVLERICAGLVPITYFSDFMPIAQAPR